MDPSGPGTCRNCGTQLHGEFCHECGQSSVIVRRPVRELMHDTLGNLLQWDTRLIHTLGKLFFKPGRLSLDWLEGKRMRYTPPFRLYIVASFILFLLFGFSINQGSSGLDSVKVGQDSLAEIDKALQEAKEAGEWLTSILLQASLEALENPAAYVQKIVSNLPKAAFLLLPLFALLHMLVDIRQGRYLVDYLIFSLHYHAFAFILVACIVLTGLISKTAGGVAQILNLAIPVYGVLAFKRFSGQGWVKSTTKAMLVFFAYSTVLSIGLIFFFAAVLLL